MSVRPRKARNQPDAAAHLELLRSAAMTYLSHGWSIVAVVGKKAGPWKKFQSRRPTSQELDRMLRRPGVTGIAVICGPVSGGLACRDFDSVQSYEAWRAKNPDLATSLPTVKTSRGFHVYFRNDHAETKKVQNGEIRGGGSGYCVLPPSLHPSGRRYEWLVAPVHGQVPRVGSPESIFPYVETENTENTEDYRDYRGNVGGVDGEIAAEVQAAIDKTQPQAPGERNAKIFQFIRELKAIGWLVGAEVNELRPYIHAWYRRALPFIATKEFEETWREFRYGWLNTKFAAGVDILKTVKDGADALTPLPEAARWYNGKETLRLVAVCREFQRLSGEKPFYLSCRLAAEMCGLSDHVTAWRRLRLLVEDGILGLIDPGRPNPEGKANSAARYKYLGPI